MFDSLLILILIKIHIQFNITSCTAVKTVYNGLATLLTHAYSQCPHQKIKIKLLITKLTTTNDTIPHPHYLAGYIFYIDIYNFHC